MYLTALPLAAVPGLRHAFFTRGEGASDGIYRGLNCGFGSADDAETVRANRARAMAALGFAAETLATPHQVHSARALIARGPDDIAGRKVDAVVTDRPGLPVGVLTADCAPVLLCDPAARVVAAAHAGWRGARFGVVEAALAAMETLGARRHRVAAAIGPTIGAASYEVGPEFPAHFLGERADTARFFCRPEGAARAHFDLPGYLAAKLRRLGLVRVHDLAADTVADPERFFSYRRSVLNGEPDYGRLLSVIALEG
ncbi:MAG: laccase domain-containing protein [Alphaproteobacteria bacterium]|nr:laccase domain-containing protein [Alphaproteobacteria bacterium]MCB9930402.1 laccase domain-containing protein [Alphaproteobacteria bacterium]